MVPYFDRVYYLNLIFLDSFSDLFMILSSSQKIVSIFHDIIYIMTNSSEKIMSFIIESDKRDFK
ncbi:hypothetical protein RJ640_003385 [Escallonia rubra]|uniref:Ycf2 N-terminal domain-containing protein n=1 Tax=Escallonia rubra TaxID=112253 RepID=A0AA88QKT9_9ASTE|nr:hypothetical protein RJ640_003385 [Escallonia rubra]